MYPQSPTNNRSTIRFWQEFLGGRDGVTDRRTRDGRRRRRRAAGAGPPAAALVPKPRMLRTSHPAPGEERDTRIVICNAHVCTTDAAPPEVAHRSCPGQVGGGDRSAAACCCGWRNCRPTPPTPARSPALRPGVAAVRGGSSAAAGRRRVHGDPARRPARRRTRRRRTRAVNTGVIRATAAPCATRRQGRAMPCPRTTVRRRSPPRAPPPPEPAANRGATRG